MATFQNMSGDPLPNKLELVVGNAFKFKLIGTPKELVPFELTSSAPLILAVIHSDAREKANFEIFTVKALKAGLAGLSAVNKQGVVTSPLFVKIRDRLQLPDAATEAGAMARLILAEAPTPFASGFKQADAKTGMQWMRLVVENRLKMASARVGSAGAKTLTDVIKSPGQFKGFNAYPEIGEKQAKNIQDILDTANDGSNENNGKFSKHVVAALSALNEPLIKDPCPTKLLGWRTAGASSPGGDFVLFKTFAGQDFYTVK
jgi:hypothetical protein